jgi:hypothetical protein
MTGPSPGVIAIMLDAHYGSHEPCPRLSGNELIVSGASCSS